PHRDYWRRRLAGPLPKLDLPTDYPRPPVQTFNGRTMRVDLNEALFNDIQRLSQEHNVSLFMALMTFVKILLHRYTGQEDILLGFPMAGRNHPDLENQIGFYVNILILRDAIRKHDTFPEVLERIKQTMTEAFDHQVYPFDILVDELNLDKDVSRPPIFDVGVTLQNNDRLALNLDKIKISDFENDWDISKIDLLFTFTEMDTQLRLDLTYNTDLFQEATIRRMTDHLEELIKSVLGGIQKPIDQLNILSQAEKHKLLEEFNATATSYPQDTTLVALFEQQAAKSPDSPAVEYEGVQLTYDQLNARANQLAGYLRDELHIQPEELVGLMVDRSEWAIIGLLGILKSGGAYLPVDPLYPQDRINYMLEDSRCRVVLTDSRYLALPRPDSVKHLIDLRSIPTGPETNPDQVPAPRNLAYVIYTSGSTGRPKGVMIEHRGFINMTLDQIKVFEVTASDRVAQFASLSFDASLSEIFMALLCGASLVLLDRETINDTARFVQFIKDRGVTVITLPPIYLSTLNKHELKPIKALITAGEPAYVDEAMFYARRKRYHNAYGPTEYSVCASIHRVDPDQAYRNIIPIGTPIANTSIFVLDDELQLLPLGIPGEICVAGRGLARGYLNRPNLTAEKFVPHPFKEGERLYRTGDQGRWLANGDLEFFGRRDDQVKVRGYRIELGEIESTLKKHQDVGEAVAMVRSRSEHEKSLVAYFTPKDRIEPWPSVAEYFVYDDVLYRAMSQDVQRNARYQAAFNQALKGKTVVEIGPGREAVLSRMCLEAGAAKVYAIEILDEVYEQARSFVNSLGLSDKIILIQGDATTVSLPEPVDYCVSEIVGGIGGSEGAAVIINQARRFLHDPACMIPVRSVTRIAAITLSDRDFDFRFPPLAGHYVEKIFDQVGHPFDLRICLKNLPQENIISSSDIFEDLDFTREITVEAEHEIYLTVSKDSLLTGFLAWLQLYPSESQVVDILEMRESWLPVYFPVFPEGVSVSAGDVVKAVISRKLCVNGLNPDYLINGQVVRQNQPLIEFR
ncbi:MAG: amino acid adenylation domain-containing protein, partial [Deltaproteobacteria bacterium]|nr:amino acid adenylation domain-containing protein [Deltaproteobacteria bacterium]